MFWIVVLGVLAVTLVIAFGYRWYNGRFTDPLPGKITEEDIVRVAKSGDTVRAIRWYRTVHGVGLKDAKEAVERLAASEGGISG